MRHIAHVYHCEGCVRAALKQPAVLGTSTVVITTIGAKQLNRVAVVEVFGVRLEVCKLARVGFRSISGHKEKDEAERQHASSSAMEPDSPTA